MDGADWPMFMEASIQSDSARPCHLQVLVTQGTALPDGRPCSAVELPEDSEQAAEQA